MDVEELKNVDLSGAKSLLLNFLIPLVALVAMGLSVYFVLLPSYRSLPKLRNELSQKQKLSGQLSAKVSALNELIDFKPLVEENSTVINRTLVDEALIPELLAQVDRMVRDAGLNVGQLSYSGTGSAGSGAGAYKTVEVALSAKGDYGALLSFLESTERASRLILLKDFRYTGSTGESTELSATFQVVSPFLKVESDAVTDEPIAFGVTDPEFLSTMEAVSSLRHYDISIDDIQPEILEEVAESTATPTETPSEEQAE